MKSPNGTAIINPRTGKLAFKVLQFEDDRYFKDLNLFNYYTIILIRKGSGHVIFDQAKFQFKGNTLIRFPINLPFQLDTNGLVEGILLQFHPDFFPNDKYQRELLYKQALFENLVNIPLLKINEEEMTKLLPPLDNLLLEAQSDRPGRYDMTIAWTEIFIIYASRIKLDKEIE